ncbi:hypothetical protein Ccel_0265 [Ruminiclostridium cellulolyticum H10]|uniref:Uncharacterized protein n=1 Tax=Ruminiclostridium cellulolyticum (strain ATCC 35319 / DSM 5812 / JCM 6584 / H10) TaxID=394503 RepID=B8I572_RUMCH|nr:hypothetical protein Ccel_0265 [Ruminiclostridium cellulolyticum H10]
MSNIIKFFCKRVLALYLVALIVCFFGKNQKLPMIIMLTISVTFSLLKFAIHEYLLKHLSGSTNKKVGVIHTLLLYLFNLGIITITFILALSFGVNTLLAALAGTLSVMIVIVINTITETLGITKNRFGEKVI